MMRHLALAAIFVGLGFGLVAFVCTKYDPRPTTIKRFAIAAVATMAIVAVLSFGAESRSGRCPDDPTQICTYNDSTPAMVFAVAVFCIVCAIRSRMIYFER